MLRFAPASLLLLASSHLLTTASAFQDQTILQPPRQNHAVDPAILAALEAHQDPVDAFIALQPEAAAELAVPRLLYILGEETPRWMTEGDKMRLRRKGTDFIDVTDHEEFYAQLVGTEMAGEARTL